MINKIYPLTTEQKRLWIEWKLYPDSAAYNNYLVYKLNGALDPNRLIQSIQTSAWDDIFRIIFLEKNGIPYQTILDLKKIHVDYTIALTLENLNALIHQTIQMPFNLLLPFPYRFLIAKLEAENCYYLTFVMHHILNDGASSYLFLNRISKSYNEGLEKPEDLLDFHNYLETPTLSHQKNINGDIFYWKNKLNNELPPLDILCRHSNKKISRQHTLIIPKDLTARLKKTAFQERTTLFLFLMAALKIVIARYFHSLKLVFLYTVNNRPKGYQNVLGFFVNTLVMITTLEDTMTFSKLLKQITFQRKEDKKYSNISLLEIFRLARHEHLKSYHYITFSKASIFNKNFILDQIDVQMLTPDFFQEALSHLAFLYDEWDDSIHFFISYNQNILEDELIIQLGKHFKQTLQSIAQDPSQKIFEIPFYNQNKLNKEFSSEPKFLLSPIFIHQEIEKYATHCPNKIAIIDGKEKINYRLLNTKANQLASYLQKQNIKHGQSIGVLIDKNFQTLIAILALLKLGAIYVPIDPRTPQQRIDHIINDSDCYCLLIAGWLEDNFHIRKKTIIINLHIIAPILETESDVNPISDISLKDIMYVIYTSGTTGLPKGVPITYGNVLSLLKATEEIFQFNSKDVWTLFHSFAFDFSVWEWCGALYYGGTLVIVPYATSRSPLDFYNLVLKEKVTILNQTPSAFYSFIEADQKNKKELNLRIIIFGGESLDYKFLAPWYELHSQNSPTLINMYGITEGTIHVTFYPITPNDVNSFESKIGKALPHMQTYVLDERKNLVPYGSIGELYITGLGLTTGYLNQPDLTVQRFIKNPFPHNSLTEKIYATGDFVKELPDGQLLYVGRRDMQVNFKGFRIELKEIETYLDRYPSIERSIVILKKEPKPELVAYLKIHKENKITPYELRQYLLKLLPTYMIPTLFFGIEKFPLTSNGKLDFLALSDLACVELSNNVFFKDESSTEAHIIQIWKNVLGVTYVDVNTNFFDCGGDSLLLLQVHTEIERIFDCKISPTILFSYSTVSSLSEYISKIIFSFKNSDQKNKEVSLRAQKRLHALNHRNKQRHISTIKESIK